MWGEGAGWKAASEVQLVIKGLKIYGGQIYPIHFPHDFKEGKKKKKKPLRVKALKKRSPLIP